MFLGLICAVLLDLDDHKRACIVWTGAEMRRKERGRRMQRIQEGVAKPPPSPRMAGTLSPRHQVLFADADMRARLLEDQATCRQLVDSLPPPSPREVISGKLSAPERDGRRIQ